MASACSWMSNGFTVSANSPSSGCGARVLGQDQHAVAVVHERRLLRDQVHPVEDRIHEQHVVLGVGGDRLGEVVRDAQIDRLPVAAGVEAVVDLARGALDRPQVLGVLGDVLAGRVELGKHRHPALPLGMVGEEEPERLQAADDVLRRVGAVDAQDDLLGPPLAQRLALGEHALVGGAAGRTPPGRPRSGARARARRGRRWCTVCRLEVDVGVGELVDAVQEVDDVARGVQADDVARQQRVVDASRGCPAAARASSRASATGCA